MKKNIIAVIPARGGSTRIPGKNYKKFNGEPIIARTIKKLKKSKIFNRIIVSTDSKKIALISKRCGAEVPFIRPKFLSGNYISSRPAIRHILRFLIKEGYEFDYVCEVYPASPFLQISDLKKGLRKIQSQKKDYVFSATPYLFPFFRSFTFSRKNGIKVLFDKYIKKRSQDLKQIMCDAGQFYWAHKETWLGKSKTNSKRGSESFTKGSDVIVIPIWRYHDIDTPDDWKRAELFYKLISKA